MFPYWLLFSVFAAGSLQSRPDFGENKPTPLLWGTAFMVALMVGLRYEVGGDWGNYLNIYYNLSYISLAEAVQLIDPAYAALNWLASEMGLSIWAVNLVCGAIFAWGLAVFAGAQPNPWLTWLVAVPYLIIVVAMGYTRQAVAIGFLMPAIVAFTRHKWGRSIAFFVIAVMFHKTAVILLPLVLGAVTRSRFLLGALFAATAVLLYYIFLDAAVDRLVTSYVAADYDSQGAAVRIMMNVLPAIVFLSLSGRLGFSLVERKLWRNFAITALVSLVALYLVASSAAVDRMALYLVPLQLAVLSRLPYVVGVDFGLSRILLVGVIAYSAIIQFVWLNYAQHSELWLPYRIYPFHSDASYL